MVVGRWWWGWTFGKSFKLFDSVDEVLDDGVGCVVLFQVCFPCLTQGHVGPQGSWEGGGGSLSVPVGAWGIRLGGWAVGGCVRF